MSGAARPRRWPLCTVLLVALALLLLFVPGLAAHARFERGLLAREPWRFFTGHLVHDQAGLATVDLLVLGALGSWWESRSRVAWAAILGASTVLASLALLVFTDFTSYVGSSALGAGLFVAALVELAGSARPAHRRLLLLALALFVAKCTLESLDRDLSLAALPPDTRVAAAAHWAGGLAGALVVLLRRRLGRADAART